jgi:light-regulated signal transduction histidine kinase (bacteriophytochrome)
VTSREPYNIEFRLLHPVRGIRWAQTIGQVERDGSGQIVKLKGTVQDITERKNAEEEIKQLNQNLESKVEERTSQLANANKELESFSYSVSHDLRAPLRAMDGFSLAVLEDYSSLLDSTGRNYLNRIREASQKMAQLIDAMLILSRVTRAEINRSHINISNLAENIAIELATHEPRRNVTWKIAPDLNALADPTLIKSVMENLLGNAWKFTSRHPRCMIEVGKMMQNGNEVFYVKDDGAGFDMKYMSKMFAPFQRLHSSTEFEGTGIGLATVNRIINKHGGRIWAEGEPEKGATIYFTLG